LKFKHIAEITPYLFNDKLIIALSIEWLDYFKRMPRVKALLNEKGDLILIAPFVQEDDKFRKVRN